jgi:hypothetical protein
MCNEYASLPKTTDQSTEDFCYTGKINTCVMGMLLYLRTTDQSTEDICYTSKINTCVMGMLLYIRL